jgi:hypothetical protein
MIVCGLTDDLTDTDALKRVMALAWPFARTR